jgi:hypothetical protein
VTNGFHDGLITESEEGTRIPLGRGNLEDNNGSPAIVARVAVSPAQPVEIGVSVHHGAYNVFNAEGTRVDDARDLTIGVLDAEVHALGFRFAGEVALAAIDIAPSLTGIYASCQRGAYVETIRTFGRGLVRTMPASTFAAKVRFDYVDFDAERTGQSTGQVTLGANFRPTQDSVLKLDFVRGRSRDEFNNRAEHAFLLFSIATYF